MAWQDDAAVYLKAHEGVISWLYLDVVGLVTIGVGLMLPTAESTQGISLVWRETKLPANAEEKAAAWRVVKKQEPAHVAIYYKNVTPLIMLPAEIDRVLTVTISGFAGNLTGRFPQMQTFPGKACVGLTDMIFSLGPQGLFRGFPEFCKAVDAKDWTAAADQCHRQHVSEERNAALRQLFLDAAAA